MSDRAVPESDDSRLGLFCGSFDPFHEGHLWLVQTAFEREAFGRLLIAVCGNPSKRSQYSLGLEQAAAIAKEMVTRRLPGADISVITSKHSLVTIALDFGCDVILRGARSSEESAEEQRSFDRIAGLLPSWTILRLYSCPEELSDVSSTNIKARLLEAITPVEYLSAAAEAVLDRRINERTVVCVLGPDEGERRALCERLSRGSFHWFRPSEAVRALADSTVPGERRMLREVAADGFAGPHAALESVDADQREHAKVLLAPYAKRAWRAFAKRYRGIFLIDGSGPALLDSSRGFVVVVGRGEESGALEDAARAHRRLEGFGQVVRFKTASTDAAFAADAAKLVTAIHEVAKGLDRYEEDRRVPDHESAIRGGLWPDLYR